MKIALLNEFVELLRNRFSNYFSDIKLNESNDAIIIDDNKIYTILTSPHGSIWHYEIQLKSPYREKAKELENMYDWKFIKDIIKDLKSKKIKYKFCKNEHNWFTNKIILLDMNLTIFLCERPKDDIAGPTYVTYTRTDAEVNNLNEVMKYLNEIHKENINIGRYKYLELT